MLPHSRQIGERRCKQIPAQTRLLLEQQTDASDLQEEMPPYLTATPYLVYTMYKLTQLKAGSVMHYHIQKWGNSLGIRIPKTLAQKAGLVEGTPVEIILGDDAIIIRPRNYSLETLLSGVTPENLHREVDTGKPVGREVW